MLIKLQKTRFSREYMVIENARNLVYSDKPLMYYSEDELVAGMQKFVNEEATVSAPKHSCSYQMGDDGSGHQGYSLEFADGYAINSLSFDNDKGMREVIRFDGEAYICNDDGKTIHRIKVGGCPSVFRPFTRDSSNVKNPITPQAA